MATSFNGGRSWSIRREPPTMGKQLIEIYADISLFGYKMLVKDVFDQNKIFEVMSIPQTAENLAANSSYSDMFSYVMATSFNGGRSWSTRREPPTMGKQLVNFITCGCESSAHFL
jgi:hypothetical protein